MTNEEYVKRLGMLYNEVMSFRKDENYIINQPQMDKLVEVLEFFIDTAAKLDGRVEPVKLVPKEEHSGVTATFIVFDVIGEAVQRFCDVMRYCSAISIDGTEDGICISCTIPNVFKPIESTF